MTVLAKYDPSQIEQKWYQYWLDNKFFNAAPQQGKKAYTLVMPPPNITGVLHMGHILNNTIQDILIRKARMEGKVACWVPGTDHASIATEAKVVRMLREKGIKKSELSRDAFIQHVWKWKEQYGETILQQLKRLGASCDWNRTTFTMDKAYQDSVKKQFIDLYHKGHIYRGLRMINWDCEAETTISNEEVIYHEQGEKSVLFSIKYQIKATEDFITVATLRPETIMGDAAVAVHPNDKRYQHLIGEKAIIPLVQREIPIIADKYVDPEFGTGCLKITPAHDPNDYEIGLRHQLNVIDILNPDGTLNKNCDIEKFVGYDRFVVRKNIVKDLKTLGVLIDTKDIITKIGRSERTQAVVEPKLSLQWFINMKDFSKKALSPVLNDEIQLYPSKFKNFYRHWLENTKDWCISRQLWWGQRIPAYFYGKNVDDFVVATHQEEALQLAKKKSNRPNLTSEDLKQDPDVLDTWVSSNLWPIAVFNGFEDNAFDSKTGKINKKKNAALDFFYPTDTLVTAPDILFFWVTRMIIAGYEYLNEKPFKNVYLTGIVRDKQKRKMSKSLGNSPDPIKLMQQYGADGVRAGMLFSTSAGNDLLFDEKLCEQGRNFANKLWNAFRLIHSWKSIEQPTSEINQEAVIWFQNQYYHTLEEIEEHFSKFRISDAFMSVYKLTWTEFCSRYLEWVKPDYGQPLDAFTHANSLVFFEKILQLLHPFLPFITEEVWQKIAPRNKEEALIISKWPQKNNFDKPLLEKNQFLFEVLSQIRKIRNEKNITHKVPLELVCTDASLPINAKVLSKLANLKNIILSNNKPKNASTFIVGTSEFCIPFAVDENPQKENEKLESELAYQIGFKKSVEKKLSNTQFLKNAPKNVVIHTKKKLADALSRIKILEDILFKK